MANRASDTTLLHVDGGYMFDHSENMSIQTLLYYCTITHDNWFNKLPPEYVSRFILHLSVPAVL